MRCGLLHLYYAIMKLVSILTSLLLACALVLLLSADLASSRKLKLQGTRSKKKLARIARRLSGDTTTKMPKSVKVRNRKCQKKVSQEEYVEQYPNAT